MMLRTIGVSGVRLLWVCVIALLIGGGQDAPLPDTAAAAPTPNPDVKQTASRQGETKTVLSDGSTLMLGGSGVDDHLITAPAITDLQRGTTRQLAPQPLLARTHHSADVLLDGRVVVTGGVDANGQLARDLVVWDSRTEHEPQVVAHLRTPRSKHHSILVETDRILIWDGVDSAGQAINSVESCRLADAICSDVDLHDAQKFITPSDNDKPVVVATFPPRDRSTSALSNAVGILFSKSMAPASITTESISLLGPTGNVPGSVVVAEDGRVVFFIPDQALLPGTSYWLFINGAQDASKHRVDFFAAGFPTDPINSAMASPPPHTAEIGNSASPARARRSDARQISVTARQRAFDRDDPKRWHPSPAQRRWNWMMHHPRSSLQSLAPLAAGAGVTALAGRVLTIDGAALPGLVLHVGRRTAVTDATGRFLMRDIPTGVQTLIIDGPSVSTSERAYGYFEARVFIQSRITNTLDYTIWMTRLDLTHRVSIPSPTTQETVITTPVIPGLELHLPAGAVLRDRSGNIKTELSITAIPTDRAPFPLPDVSVPVYFTIQPGGVFVQGLNAKSAVGARLIYPNYKHLPAGSRADFWNYDAQMKGWYVYGQGTVTADGTQVVPDPGVVLYEFTGAMLSPLPSPGTEPKPDACKPDCNGPPAPSGGCSDDPVDCSSGLFIINRTDLVVQDTLPISVERTYRQNDKRAYSFGTGWNLSYDYYLSTGPGGNYNDLNLILPDGAKVYFPATTPGTGTQP